MLGLQIRGRATLSKSEAEAQYMGWTHPAVLGVLLLAAAGSSHAADPVPTPAHRAYAKLYNDFDEGAKLSDGHKCFDETAQLNRTVLSTTKQQSVDACRKTCQYAHLPVPTIMPQQMDAPSSHSPAHCITLHKPDTGTHMPEPSSSRVLAPPSPTQPVAPPPDPICSGRDAWQCSSWLMCEDDQGCLDGTGSTIGKHMCQLREESRKPWGIPASGHHLVLPSNFASGYVKREPMQLVVLWFWIRSPLCEPVTGVGERCTQLAPAHRAAVPTFGLASPEAPLPGSRVSRKLSRQCGAEACTACTGHQDAQQTIWLSGVLLEPAS